ncbi:hypothetical protein B0H16DRAFT_1781669 [Mycena metata]|uniref:Uncharacterized protein n=1 Tax=Mycena metata TaxID=1033252 RepID=A0AAD7HQA9_9AGAR|nr:hypothetical protein B0H16DRAFT_1781669 [Mycena metata]
MLIRSEQVIMVALTNKFLLLLPFAAAFVRAANDWSVKCQGECSYDTNGTKGRAFASVSLVADKSQVLSDITSAASWELLDCPADWSSGSKDVRLVCVADDPTQDCNDVTEGGAVDTLVRLPEDCGTGPFARIATWGVSTDQTIPAGSTAASKLKLRKRGAPPAQVMAATLDWKLGEVPASRGTVKLELKASNTAATHSQIVSTRNLKHALRSLPCTVASAWATSAAPLQVQLELSWTARRMRPQMPPRQLEPLSTARRTRPQMPPRPLEPSSTARRMPPQTPPEQLEMPLQLPPGQSETQRRTPPRTPLQQLELPTISTSAKNGALDTISVKDNFPLFDTSLSCNIGLFGFDATVNANVDLDAQMNVGFAILMNGTVVPPAIDKFGLAAAVSGYANGTINISALLSGDIDSGNIPVFKAVNRLPGLSLPGLFTLGPEAEIDVSAGAGFDVNADVAVPITWNFPLLDFVIPPTEGNATGDATQSDTSVDFSASFTPGTLNANADHGFAKAEVFVSADVDGSLDMNSTIADDFSMDGCFNRMLTKGEKIEPVSTSNAGARGTLLEILQRRNHYSYFQQRAQLFQKCFGADDGPASAVLDNGDGTFTNAAGESDLVNENGELIDDTGAVIPDDAAAPPTRMSLPLSMKKGNPIPDDTVSIDNGDGTFEDGLGNPSTTDGQLIDDKGNLLGSEVDLTNIQDDNSTAIAPDDVILENEDGTFTANDGSQLDADGVPVDANGLVTGAGMEDVVDENGAAIDPDDLIIDNEDGSYSDFFGNLVDQWGGAIDIANDTTVIPVTLAPQAVLQQPNQTDDAFNAAAPGNFTIKTQDEIKQIASDLLNAPPAAAAPPPPPPPPPAGRKRSTDAMWEPSSAHVFAVLSGFYQADDIIVENDGLSPLILPVVYRLLSFDYFFHI